MLSLQACILDFFPQDRVRVPDDLQLLFSDLPDYPDSQARTWERLPPYQVVWQTQFSPKTRTSSLNNCHQRFNQLELHVLSKPPTLWWLLIVWAVSVPDSIVGTRSLGQELGVLDLLGLIVEDLHEFVTDDLPLLFWVELPRASLDMKLSLASTLTMFAQPFFKSGHNFIAFVLSKQAVVDKNRRQLAADCPCAKG